MKMRSRQKSLRRPGAVCLEPVESRLLFASAISVTVTNSNDSGAGSLRAAILQTNANLNNLGESDEILINIGGADHTVEVLTPLPVVTGPVSLGEPAVFGTDTSHPLIELNGSAAGVSANGLVLQTTGSFVTGVAINRFKQDGLVIQGDANSVSGAVFIGTDIPGTAALGNLGRGILVQGNNNTVSLVKVVNNGNDGIRVSSGTGNDLSYPGADGEIRSNGGQAIDIGLDGVTPNDLGDADTGSNNSQNFPVLTSLTYANGAVTVAGTLNTTPSTSVSLDFFASPVAAREGWDPLSLNVNGAVGTPVVTTNSAGNASFSFKLYLTPTSGTFPSDPNAVIPVPTNSVITATATAATVVNPQAPVAQQITEYNTSEFSAPISLPAWLGAGSAATWDPEAHTLNVFGPATIIADPGTDAPLVTASVAAAVLSIAPTSDLRVTFGGLNLSGGATANVSATGAERALVINNGATLSIVSSKLNLTDNALAVQNANATAAGAANTLVNSLVRSAFNNFAWDGPGITSTTVQTNINNDIPSALGILFNNDGDGGALFYGNGSDLPKFDNVSVNSNSVLVRFTRFGDSDLNGSVNTVDFSLFQAGYSHQSPYVGFAFGDYDYNGVINTVDFGLFQAGYAP